MTADPRPRASRAARSLVAAALASVLLTSLGACSATSFSELDRDVPTLSSFEQEEPLDAPFHRRTVTVVHPDERPTEPRAVLDEARRTLMIERTEFASCPVEPTRLAFDGHGTFSVDVSSVLGDADGACEGETLVIRTEFPLAALPAPGALAVDVTPENGGEPETIGIERFVRAGTLSATTTMPPHRQVRPSSTRDVAEAPATAWLSADRLTLSIARWDSATCWTHPATFEFDGDGTVRIGFENRPEDLARPCFSMAGFLGTEFELPGPAQADDITAIVSGLESDEVTIPVAIDPSPEDDSIAGTLPFYRRGTPTIERSDVGLEPFAALSEDGRTLTLVRTEADHCPQVPVEVMFDGDRTIALTLAEILPSPTGSCSSVGRGIAIDIALDVALDVAPPPGDLRLELREYPLMESLVVDVERP